MCKHGLSKEEYEKWKNTKNKKIERAKISTKVNLANTSVYRNGRWMKLWNKQVLGQKPLMVVNSKKK